MFEEFFRKCEIQDPEKITAAQSENIKSALQKKLAADNSQPKFSTEEKEENIMKTKTIRTIIIAAAVAVVGLGGIVGASAMGAFRTSKEIAADLAEKNKVSPEFAEEVSKAKEEHGDDVFIVPDYEDMEEINELVIREFNSAEYKGLWDEYLPGIILDTHVEGGGASSLIKPDGNGGYMYAFSKEAITDEKLLAAIAEGTEKYGDTFVIQY